MKFRKKPVVIEAIPFTGGEEEGKKIVAWIQLNGGKAKWNGKGGGHPYPENIKIETLEGTMFAIPGDWIIQGVQGEFYPCKPDIFAATYDPA